ncbi:MAG TPA: DNA mismatch repair endonuclease MutL, partial [Pyrinomonadaceae bacterium]|nr:DNA mismatch repair endonuclease MutL [Pyrinomonadaceae bacterium]
PRGTTIAVRDLFFNVPARRKFLRSEATETFHLTNLVTHYGLAHPEIAFTFSNNGRVVLSASPAKDLKERAYQIFGEEFLENLLTVNGGHPQVAHIGGYISAPRDRRTSRDSQYIFVNRRFVRDRLIGRALSEGYRSILPHGVYPAALLFIETPLEEVDVNVHPAKTEVRFRRAAAVADAVRESVRAALASAGYAPAEERITPPPPAESQTQTATAAVGWSAELVTSSGPAQGETMAEANEVTATLSAAASQVQPRIDFVVPPLVDEMLTPEVEVSGDEIARDIDELLHARELTAAAAASETVAPPQSPAFNLPPLNSAERFAREVKPESLSANIRPLGQLDESFIIATDDEGLLLIDQHVAHERILFDKYRALEAERRTDSQQLLVPETFDLTPAQAAVFDQLAPELEPYGFDLMRLSGRTVAIKATPADLPPSEARNMLAELLETVDAEKKSAARETLRDEIAASLACHAAIKVNMPLAPEKMRWLIDRLLQTSSPTTCPHGRPVILRLRTRDILKGFHRI